MKTTTLKTTVLAIISAVGMCQNLNAQSTTAGYLYGTTMGGGKYGNGTVFSFNLATRQETAVIDFDTTNGIEPLGNLTMDNNNGSLYGATLKGGAYNDGVLFSFNPATGKDSNLVIFNDTNGKWPVQGSATYYNGNIYGMTSLGGNYGFGAVYRYNPAAGTYMTMLSFDTANGQEYGPMGSNLAAYPGNGLLYGMTYSGGNNKMGTIFSFNPLTGIDNVVVSLDSLKGFQAMEGTLTLSNGLFYGVTSAGGLYGNGVLFSFNPVTNQYNVLVNFNVMNGSNPYGGLLNDSINGLLYGMTYGGGAQGYGVLYSFNPVGGTEQVLVNFNDTANGSGPTGNLTLAPDGKLYGMTLGDVTGNGLLFCYDPVSATDSVLFTFNYTGGSSPYGSLIFVGNPGAIDPILTGIQNVSAEGSISVYPNPFSVNTNIVTEKEGVHYIEVDDMMGRKLNRVKFSGNQYSLSRTGLATGMYIVKLFDEQEQYVSAAKIEVN